MTSATPRLDADAPGARAGHGRLTSTPQRRPTPLDDPGRRLEHLLDRLGPHRLVRLVITTPLSHGSSVEVSNRTGILVTIASIASSRLTPITPPRGPVMPTSVM